jgi:uncharacterized membrane protein YkvA (DUF1232 family)
MKAPWNFARFLPLAGRLLARGRLPTLLFAVASKGAAQGNRLGKLKDDLRLLQALCLAYWRGEYRAISGKALVSVVAGLMYFLSPVDAIPDFIPVFGMLDDIAVLAWLMKTLDDELNALNSTRSACGAVVSVRKNSRLPNVCPIPPNNCNWKARKSPE